MNKIKEMVILVTGASSGIGRALSLMIAGAGGTVGLLARNKDELAAVAEECRAKGGTALELVADVTESEQVRDAARLMMESFGRIDAWVNNAGVYVMGRLEEVPPETVRRVLEVDLLGYCYGAQAVIPIFREQGHGTLVNVSSIEALAGAPFSSPYVAAKAGIEGLSKSLRMELRDAPGIRVCTVRPPSIDTPLLGHAANYTGLAITPLKPVLPVEAAAQEILRVIRHPRNNTFVGRSTPIFTRMAMIPGIGARWTASKVERKHLGTERAGSSDGTLYAPGWDDRVSGGWRRRQHPVAKGVGIAFLSLGVVLGVVGWRRTVHS